MDINVSLIGQMITFLIFVGFTMKFVWPPISKAMDERAKKIADGLEAAERGKRELELADHQSAEKIQEAKLEASKIIDQANKRASHIVEEAKENARHEGKHILASAQDEIDRRVLEAKEVLKAQLASLAVSGAERILQQKLDAKGQQHLLDELATEI